MQQQSKPIKGIPFTGITSSPNFARYDISTKGTVTHYRYEVTFVNSFLPIIFFLDGIHKLQKYDLSTVNHS
ncbi:hypothetical protein ACUOFC_31235, partial [Escherichia sp. TWPC-MK]